MVDKPNYKDKKAIIFDLFGTLTNGQADPEKRIIDQFDLNVDYKTVERYVCGTVFKSEDQYFGEIINGINLPRVGNTRPKLKTIFKEDIGGEYIKKDVPKVLQELKDRNYQIGIISDIPNPDYNLIKRAGLGHYFDAFILSYETGLTKPNPKVMEKMLQKLELKNQEVLYIGDSLGSDFGLAQNTEVDFILIDRENKNASFKGNRINSLSELATYL